MCSFDIGSHSSLSLLTHIFVLIISPKNIHSLRRGQEASLGGEVGIKHLTLKYFLGKKQIDVR